MNIMKPMPVAGFKRKWHKKRTPVKSVLSAQDWNRTSTPVKAADFESAASTNSATWAGSVLRAAMLQHSIEMK